RWRVQRGWEYEVYESLALASASRDATDVDSSPAKVTDVKSGGYIKTEESTNTDSSTKTEKQPRDSEKPKAKAKTFDPLKVELPDNVPPELWADFVAHRSEIRKKLTPTATKRLLTRLQGFGPGAETAL